LLHVPYKSNPLAVTDLLGGQIDMMITDTATGLPQVKAGKVRALGVTAPKRTPLAPDVPTIDEAGVKGYESLSWSGIMAPAGTPRRVIDRLNAAIEKILRDPEVRQRFAGLGVEPVGGPPETFARHIRAESEKWSRVVKTANITLN